MRNALLLLLLSCASLLGATGADLYVNFEGIANGTALGSVNMGTISKTNGDAVTFSTDIRGTGSAVKVVDDTAHAGLLRPVLVNGTFYTNSSPTKALLCDSFGTGGDLVKFVWSMKASSRKVSYGYSITLTNWGGGGNFYNAGGLEVGVDYAVLSMVDNSPPIFQCENNTSPYGADINVGNFTIWVSGLWDSANNIAIQQYYNQTNMVLLGFSTAPIAHNAAVRDFGWGVTGAHGFSANRNYYLNNLLLYTNGNVFPVWPGSALQVPTNSSGTAISSAITAMSNGDWLVLPGTNITVTSGFTFAKNSSTVYGIGGTNKSVILADGVIDCFTVTGTLNTFTNFTITGDGVNDEATGFVSSGYHNRYTKLLLSELDIAFYAQAPGLMDQCTLLDNNFMARNIFGFGSGFFTTYYPLANDSTNQMVYEDCVMNWTAGKNATGSGRLMSSQEDDAWMVRHCSFDLNKAGAQPQPMFDYHGDWDPGSNYNPGLLLQIYSNYFNIHGSAISAGCSKFADIRGGVSLIYSNMLVGDSFCSTDGIVYREEHPFPGDQIPWQVTNSYAFQNYDGATGTHAMPVNNDGIVTLNTDYFTTAPATLVQLPYPHPMRGGVFSGGSGGGTINAATGLRIRTIRFK